MTVPVLIDTLLNAIHTKFYADRGREFYRDMKALTKAIARYGYACNDRGWNLQADFILDDILALLLGVRKSRADIRYLPLYLENAIDRHIRQRAEEIQAAAQKTTRAIKLVQGLKTVEAIREPSTVEILATVYQHSKPRRKKAKSQTKTDQMNLF